MIDNILKKTTFHFMVYHEHPSTEQIAYWQLISHSYPSHKLYRFEKLKNILYSTIAFGHTIWFSNINIPCSTLSPTPHKHTHTAFLRESHLPSIRVNLFLLLECHSLGGEQQLPTPPSIALIVWVVFYGYSFCSEQHNISSFTTSFLVNLKHV